MFMFVLGLTGPTGAGKSLLAGALAQEGFAVLDADSIAHGVIEKDCLPTIVYAFGKQVIRPDGGLDRKKLASMVFSDPQALAQLNAITHPAIVAEIDRQLQKLARQGCEKAVLDAPTLFESGAQRLCSRVLAVTASRESRVARIMERDGLSGEAALARVNGQPTEAFYTARADYVLANEAGMDGAGQAARTLAREIADELSRKGKNAPPR